MLNRIRDLTWSTASRMGLHGMCPWRFQPHHIQMNHLDMPLPGRGRPFEGMTVVHLSDLHCSPVMSEAHLHHYIDLINIIEPDFVVMTGDFITVSAKTHLRRIGNVLRDLSPRIASLACLGNHDYGIWHPTIGSGVPGLGDCVAEQLDRAGITVLLNESRTFRKAGEELQFVGLGDLWTSTYDPDRAMGRMHDGSPVIALSHNPDAAIQLADMGADYILSGHTHGKTPSVTRLGNMVFPMRNRTFIAGHYDLDNGKSVYVNRGLGHACIGLETYRPEITVFTLCPTTPAPLDMLPTFEIEDLYSDDLQRENTDLVPV